MNVIDQHDIEGSMSQDVQHDNEIVILSEHEEQHGNIDVFFLINLVNQHVCCIKHAFIFQSHICIYQLTNFNHIVDLIFLSE